MKSILIKYTLVGAVIISLTQSACVKKVDGVLVGDKKLSDKSMVQVYMAMVNPSRNYIYVNNAAVNGASITQGTLFPATGPGFAIDGGFKSFLIRDTLTATTQVPLSFANDFQAGKNYTVFVYDTITSPKQVTVQTDIVVPSDNTARLRFGNFTYSPTAPPAVDIFSKRLNTNIFTNVPVSQVTGFMPYNTNVTDTFYVRETGTGVNLKNWDNLPAPGGTFVDIIAVLTPRPQRSYTLVFRGGYRASNLKMPPAYTTANPTLRQLSTFINY
ncbi:MAG: DUF4397 domain-containing protein [Chitinophagaceae bacterium]|nr:DUF4397 domain-containing protein [Chitinophagaceae bacterium]